MRGRPRRAATRLASRFWRWLTTCSCLARSPGATSSPRRSASAMTRTGTTRPGWTPKAPRSAHRSPSCSSLVAPGGPRVPRPNRCAGLRRAPWRHCSSEACSTCPPTANRPGRGPAVPRALAQVVVPNASHVNDLWGLQPQAMQTLIRTFFDTGEVAPQLHDQAPGVGVPVGMPTIAKAIAASAVTAGLVSTDVVVRRYDVEVECLNALSRQVAAARPEPLPLLSPAPTGRVRPPGRRPSPGRAGGRFGR